MQVALKISEGETVKEITVEQLPMVMKKEKELGLGGSDQTDTLEQGWDVEMWTVISKGVLFYEKNVVMG